MQPASVVDRIRERAAAFPGNVALVDGDARFTYAELFERVDRLSAAISALGLAKGDAVLAYLPNVHEAVECELAALQSGLAWITLTSRLTWPEVRGVMLSCTPKLVVTSAAGRRAMDEGAATLPIPALPQVIVVGEEYEALLAAHSATRQPVVVGAEDVARLRYTSGTTGDAKAAVLPHRVYHASLDNLTSEFGPFTEGDVALHAAPLTHGSGALVHPVLFAGGTNLLVQRFDPAEILGLVEDARVTTMFAVPTMLSRLLAFPDVERRDLTSLRALVYGGAPMPAAQLDAAVASLGPVLFQIYGMTEAPWPITVLRPEEHRRGGPRLGSVGRPAPGVEVRIVDAGGDPVPDGTAGEIHVRGPNVMTGYHRDEASTRAVLRGGWLATGDLGRIDDGFVTIVGREKDVIISGGFNVYATEVEAALSTHEGVLEAAVVGVPDGDWGEVVCAYVVPRPGAAVTAAELDAVARRLLSGYKCPRRIELVSDLPKTATGKIRKSDIARRRC